MKFKNGAVEFCEIKQDSFVHDYDENIPFNEYLYKEELGDNFVDIRTSISERYYMPLTFMIGVGVYWDWNN